MGLIEFLLIAVGVIAAAFLMVIIVRRISAYYRQRHNMSVWAGVFTLVLAIVAGEFAVYHYERVNVLLIIAAGLLVLLTVFLDTHHAGVGMGLLALLFQMFLAVTFIIVIIAAIIYFVIRSIRRGNDMVLDAVTGTTSEFRNGVQLFFRFFMP
ncbi:MAG: hypothetical protein NC409_10190 [Clostridium sp.]|nr:hypothetical protein [Clostridium sp.]